MPVLKNYAQVIAHLASKPNEVQEYFEHFGTIASKTTLEAAVPYVFSRVELAKHNTIYCGIVKLHWADAELARKCVDSSHMSREQFENLFEIVFAKKIDRSLLGKLKQAEAIRDKIVHGKPRTEAECREALANIFDFAEEFNGFVYNFAKFKPFGSLRGFKGRAKPLSKSTTRWILKGMGFAM